MKKLTEIVEENGLSISRYIEDVEVKYNSGNSVTLTDGDQSVTLEEDSIQEFIDFINLIKTK